MEPRDAYLPIPAARATRTRRLEALHNARRLVAEAAVVSPPAASREAASDSADATAAREAAFAAWENANASPAAPQSGAGVEPVFDQLTEQFHQLEAQRRQLEGLLRQAGG